MAQRAPAGVRAKSGLETGASGKKGSSQFDVKPSPRLIVDEPPAMSGSGRVGRQQYVAWAQHKRLAIACGELQSSAERDDELLAWRGVPVARGAGRGLLEMRHFRWRYGAQRKRDMVDVRAAVASRIEVNAADYV